MTRFPYICIELQLGWTAQTQDGDALRLVVDGMQVELQDVKAAMEGLPVAGPVNESTRDDGRTKSRQP